VAPPFWGRPFPRVYNRRPSRGHRAVSRPRTSPALFRSSQPAGNPAPRPPRPRPDHLRPPHIWLAPPALLILRLPAHLVRPVAHLGRNSAKPRESAMGPRPPRPAAPCPAGDEAAPLPSPFPLPPGSAWSGGPARSQARPGTPARRRHGAATAPGRDPFPPGPAHPHLLFRPVSYRWPPGYPPRLPNIRRRPSFNRSSRRQAGPPVPRWAAGNAAFSCRPVLSLVHHGRRNHPDGVNPHAGPRPDPHPNAGGLKASGSRLSDVSFPSPASSKGPRWPDHRQPGPLRAPARRSARPAPCPAASSGADHGPPEKKPARAPPAKRHPPPRPGGRKREVQGLGQKKPGAL